MISYDSSLTDSTVDGPKAIHKICEKKGYEGCSSANAKDSANISDQNVDIKT